MQLKDKVYLTRARRWESRIKRFLLIAGTVIVAAIFIGADYIGHM